MLNSILLAKLAPAFLLIGRATAAVCVEGITNDTALTTREVYNPVSVHNATGVIFAKYNTPLLDGTEAEIVALEYTGRYEQDTEGMWWIVSRDGKPLSRMTKMYGEHFAPRLPMSRSYVYEYNATDFDDALRSVRGDVWLQDQAMQWAMQAKASYWEHATGGLGKRREMCGPAGYVCESSDGCKLMGNRYCTQCIESTCYDPQLPDAC